MRKGKQAMPVAEGWKLYQALQTVEVSGPVSYAVRFQTRLPVFGKQKKKNASRKDLSVEYQYQAYRFRGYPDKAQAAEMAGFIGCCRFLWNRMLADRRDFYRVMGTVLKNTPADYKDIPELSWLNGCDSLALCNVQLNLERAFSEWLSGEKGKPRFKKKGLASASYKTNAQGNSIRLENGKLKLPKVTGMVRLAMHRKVREGGTLKNVTVTQEPDGKWYFSLVYAYEKKDPLPECFCKREEEIRAVGLDMSLPELYRDSSGNLPSYEVNGVTVSFRKVYRKLEKKIAREQRRLSKMEKDSANYRRQCRKVAKLHAKAKHQRCDFLHQMAARLAAAYDIIGVEDLDMAAIRRSLRFGKSVSDNGWGNFLLYLEEACRKHGTLLIRVNRWFPSSKTCSVCGHVHRELALSDRTYACQECGSAMDRDENAAVNIREEALRIFRGYLNEEKQETLPEGYVFRTA